MRDKGKMIIALSTAIVDAMDCVEDADIAHVRGACMRATMIFFIRSGFSYEDFKEIVNKRITEQCYANETLLVDKKGVYDESN